MVRKFSAKTIDELRYYVYIYSDPDTHKPFYVGKGKGNREFDHLTDTSDSEKVKYLNRLKDDGKEPIIELLVHGVDSETAEKVEAAVIDLIGKENLTNAQLGHGAKIYGRISVDKIEARYNPSALKDGDFTENVMLININKLYRNDMTPMELYDATRGLWPVNPDRASKVEYACAVYKGMTLEVYKIAGWFPAYSTMMTRDEVRTRTERFEFVGNIAEENIRNKYKDKSVASYYVKGAQKNIRYLGPDVKE